MAGWDNERALLHAEVTQRQDEGCTVPRSLVDAIAALTSPADDWDEVRTAPLWQALAQLQPDAALERDEPNELDAIRALRPTGPRDLHWQPGDAELVDRLHGAWTGRAVGCALGKPVESGSYGMAMDSGRSVGRQRIRQLLEARGEWPLRDYFSATAPDGHAKLRCKASTREHIAYMEPDDDIHYTLVGLGVLEDVGPDFAWWDVAWYWTQHLPYSAICTAETQAILNFWRRSAHMERGRTPSGSGATPEWTRSHRNPYREWIGAQIRSDGWAWACAGKPELAAEFAWRDACWTHTRNGIYGEMLFAAIQAAAFVEHDVRRCVEIGLSEIPQDCRLARWVRAALEWHGAYPNLEAALDRMEEEDVLRRMSPVHTINNAVACVLALLYSEVQVDTATCAAVMAGLDTDCNGATVGSVVGAMTGREGYRGELAARLNDTVRPAMLGFQDVRMRALAERHAAVWRRVDAWHAQRRDTG
jgi:ADP-ribosylglycohydrolase